MELGRLAFAGMASAGLALAGAAVGAARAHAYEFAIEARTIGQAYQLRVFQSPGRDALLNRRRFTEALGVHLWDLLTPAVDPAFPDRPRERAPFDLYFTSSMRLDHDFAAWHDGAVSFAISPTDRTTRQALEVVPELSEGDLDLDVLYAYLGGRGIGGFLDFELGRQAVVEPFEWLSFDGLTVHAHTPLGVTVEARAGLRVSGDSPVASSTTELDGTSLAQCAEFDGATWTLGVTGFGVACRQREALQPTFGFALASEPGTWGGARLSYRRTSSRTDEAVFGPTLAPLAPAWGVDEEVATASFQLNLLGARVVPAAAARWNFLVGQPDETRAWVRFAFADQGVTPEYRYSFPTLDGDSIFNVFALEPYQDLRLTWDVWPGRGTLRGYGRVLGRRFAQGDEGADAAGAGAGLRWRPSDRGRARLDLSYEDGFGGLRAGADATTRWRVRETLELEGRLTVVQWQSPDDANAALGGRDAGISFGAQAGGRWLLADGIALHVWAEENVNPVYPSQFRLVAVLDLAFAPEL
jgi:hypothetical protein